MDCENWPSQRHRLHYLYRGCVLDTRLRHIYAHQDKLDDELVGIKSTALLLGEQSRPWMFGFYAVFFAFVLIAGRMNDLYEGFYIGIACAAALVFYHLARWDMDNPKDCLRRFCANRDIGLVILAALVVGKWL